eukprot:TRINITY_DN12627_c0_g2_i9.p1 TRINITY_DN12627_c0_g2~~TRINITY_DN12627_c0_g2_i9.p1  ORF type:complete len:604 (+),score=147.78 TRINITY_DN12627_c0_g2_i9:154-1965(+)
MAASDQVSSQVLSPDIEIVSVSLRKRRSRTGQHVEHNATLPAGQAGQCALVPVKQELTGDAQAAAADSLEPLPDSPAVTTAKAEHGFQVTPDKLPLMGGRKRRLLRKTSAEEVKLELGIKKDPTKQEDSVDDLKDEAKGELAVEVKQDEFKEDVKDDIGTIKIEVKDEVKEEGIKEEVKEEVKEEIQEEVKEEIKQEVKEEVKEEIKEEVKEEVEGAGKAKIKKEVKNEGSPLKRRRISVKSEPTGQGSSFVTVKREPGEGQMPMRKRGSAASSLETKPSFTKELPKIIQMCTNFQKEKRTWMPTRPCCPANFFLSSVGPPPKPERGAEPKACYHHLTKSQRREMRLLFESRKADLAFSGQTTTQRRLSTSSSSKSCVGSERAAAPVAYLKLWPWMRELHQRIWTGRGWSAHDNEIKKLADGGGCDTLPGLKLWQSEASGNSSHASVEGVDGPECIQKGKAAIGDSDSSSVGNKSTSMSSDPRLQHKKPDAKMSGGAVLLPKQSCSSDRHGKIITRVAKRSGVSNISWTQEKYAWRLQYSFVKGGKQAERREREACELFPVSRFRNSGFSESEADQAILVVRLLLGMLDCALLLLMVIASHIH